MARKRKRTTTRTIKPKRKGQKPLRFKQGALRRQLGVSKSTGKIPAKRMAKARSGALGPKAKKRALFAQNVLKGRRKGR